MSKVHFITNSSNLKKFEGVKRALEKIPQNGFFFSGISLDTTTVKPISKKETTTCAFENASALFPLYECSTSKENIYSIGIQKGVTVLDEEEPLSLVCAVVIVNADYSKKIFAHKEILLEEEVRFFYKNKKSVADDLYECLELVYGKDVFEKKISLYEKITGKTETEWFESVVFKALSF